MGRIFSLSREDLQAIQVDFWKNIQWDDDLLAFIRSLRPQYKTGTISDAWPDARNNVRRRVNHELFDVIVFSSEEGVMKPDPEIYRRALARLGVAAPEAIFVDDRPKNILGAQQIGMLGIRHTDTQRTIEEILQLLQPRS